MSDAVDLVIAGHSHSVLDARVPNRTGRGDKLVVEAGEYGTAYDRAVLTIDRASGDVVKKRASVRRTWNADVAPRSDVTALVAEYAGRAARLGGQVLGHLRRGLRRRAGSDADGLGRLMADSQRSLARADVAFVDPVSIRAGLKPGPVTYSGLFEVAPYEHPVLRMKIRGEALARVVASQKGERSGPKLISSGVRARGTALSLEAGGYVEPRRTYTVAAGVLLATGRRAPLLREATWERRPVGTELDALVSRFRSSIGASGREDQARE